MKIITIASHVIFLTTRIHLTGEAARVGKARASSDEAARGRLGHAPVRQRARGRLGRAPVRQRREGSARSGEHERGGGQGRGRHVLQRGRTRRAGRPEKKHACAWGQ